MTDFMLYCTITVLELPPSESCSSLVSLEFLYGTWVRLPSTSAEMTFPRVDRDKLILVASTKRSPVAPVFDCRSEPYKHIGDSNFRELMTSVVHILLDQPDEASPFSNAVACLGPEKNTQV